MELPQALDREEAPRMCATLHVELELRPRADTIWKLAQDIPDQATETQCYWHEPAKVGAVPVEFRQNQYLSEQVISWRVATHVISNPDGRWHMPVSVFPKVWDETGRIDKVHIPKPKPRSPQGRIQALPKQSGLR